jgi:hypothetical protein
MAASLTLPDALCGRVPAFPAAIKAVCDLDLEGIVAKRLEDRYSPRTTKWWKILNRDYSQKHGRSELFERRYG